MSLFPVRLRAGLIALLLVVGSATVGPALPALAAGGPSAVTLTPATDTARSQTFTWRTARKRSGQYVQLKLGSGRQFTAAARFKMRLTRKYSGVDAYAYTATATGLRPDTRYSYRVVTPTGSTDWTSFATATVGLQRPWTFLSFGDTQVANTGVPERIIDTAVARHGSAPLLLHAGDVVNKPNSAREWRQFMAATHPTRVQRNWLISIGNHEQCGLLRSCRSGNGQAFRASYTWPRNGYPQQGPTWFSTDYQGVRFVVLDTFGGKLARQSAFLDRALRTNKQKWTVVLMHSGPFASRADRTNATMRKYFLPAFTKYDVDLVLSGHDHSYNRGYRGRSKNSTVYAVSVSGKKFYPASARDWRRGHATRVRSASQTATYQTVTVRGDTLTYQAVVAYKGRKATTSRRVGERLDRVVITKDGRGKRVR